MLVLHVEAPLPESIQTYPVGREWIDWKNQDPLHVEYHLIAPSATTSEEKGYWVVSQVVTEFYDSSSIFHFFDLTSLFITDFGSGISAMGDRRGRSCRVQTLE